MKYLIENGADITTLPMACVLNDQLEALQYLISLNADLSEMNATHAPAIFVAVSQRRMRYIEILLENGADLSQSFNGISFIIYL